MRATLPDQGALDWGPTTPAGLARSAIDPEEILVVALRINPINGRAVVLDAVVQRPLEWPYAAPQLDGR